MARKKKGKRGHVVPVPSTKDPNHLGTITVEDQRAMERNARNLDQIKSGIKPAAGAHGGNKRDKRRKQRREGKNRLRNL